MDISVVGGFEHAVSAAINNVVPMISGLATRMGLAHRMTSVEVIDTPVLELHSSEALLKSLFEASCGPYPAAPTCWCWAAPECSEWPRPCSPGWSPNRHGCR